VTAKGVVPTVVKGASRGDSVAQVELVAAPATRVIAGRTVELLTYNGAFPGPLLRFREGDRVRILLTNRLGEATNLHLHGLHIPPAVDDYARMVADGDTVAYEFELLPGSAGTYWYHPHAHGSVGRQLFAGLAGPLIIDGRDNLAGLATADERILVLKDLAIDGSRVSPHSADDWLNGKEGELVLVNGELQPRIAASSGLLRLRLINACNARYLLLGVDDHDLTVLGAGTGFAETPVKVDTLLLAPGERTDVLVALHGTGAFRLVARPYDRGADMSGMGVMRGADMSGMHDMRGADMSGMHDMPQTGEMGTIAEKDTAGTEHTLHGSHGGLPSGGHAQAADHGASARLGNRQPITLATFTATQFGPPPRLREALASLPPYDPDRVSERRRIVFSEEMGQGTARFLINGKTFEPGRIDFHSQRGAIERCSTTPTWTIRSTCTFTRSLS
jgi:FtsP/CotA-like multicopper oxidase with cupredoxin domain